MQKKSKRKNVNRNEVDIYNTVCVMRGFYDEGGEYREKHYDDVALFELPEKAQIRINFNYSYIFFKFSNLIFTAFFFIHNSNIYIMIFFHQTIIFFYIYF